MITESFELDDYAINILKTYHPKYAEMQTGAICFQIVENDELDDFTKYRASLNSEHEIDQLVNELIKDGYNATLIDPFGVPRASEKLQNRSIDFIAICKKYLAWPSFNENRCHRLLHPDYGNRIFIGGMIITDAPRDIVDYRDFFKKGSMDQVAA